MTAVPLFWYWTNNVSIISKPDRSHSNDAADSKKQTLNKKVLKNATRVIFVKRVLCEVFFICLKRFFFVVRSGCLFNAGFV